MDNNDKKSKNNNLILLKSLIKEEKTKEIELSESEQGLKSKLLEIEKKLDSMEKVMTVINSESESGIYSSEVFSTIIGSIAIAAAIGVVSDYFEVDKNDLSKLLE